MNLGVYSLHDNYAELFKADSSPELMFYFKGDLTLKKGFGLFSDIKNRVIRQIKGTAGQSPSLELLCAYTCIDGLPIDESSLYNPKDPFANRDPRLAMTIQPFKTKYSADYAEYEQSKIDGTFPDTSRLIPDSFDYSMSIDSTSLLNSIDRASLLTNEQTNIVKLTMNQDTVILSSFSQEIGSVEENLSRAFYKGKPLKISFSARYLTDAIKSINGQKVRVLFTGEMKPFIIKDFEREDIIQLVLPVRTY